MLKLSKACQMVTAGFSLDDLKYGKKQYDREDKFLLQRVLLVENRIFQIYLKTGKYNPATFPYDSLKENMAMNKAEMVKVAKSLLQSGWKPSTHVVNTRKKFSVIPDYQSI